MKNTSNGSFKLGTLRLTLLVAGNIIGSGVFLLPSALAVYGSISLAAWIYTALGALMLALVFAELGTVLPQEGGFYGYCREAFGDFVGFQVAYNYWIALWVGNAALVVALTSYLGHFWPVLLAKPGLACIVNVSIIWSLTLLNCSSMRYMTWLQTGATVIKILPLFLVIIVGIFSINFDHFKILNFSDKPLGFAFNEAATMTLWSFLGLESATLITQYAKNPKRDIPKATILGVLVAAILYIGGYIAIIGIVPFKSLVHSKAPYVDAMQPILGNFASHGVAILAVFSCLGALMGWILLQGQVPLAAARDQLFPAIFLRENKQKVPIAGLIISSTLITGLLLLQLEQNLIAQFTFIVLLATLASLIPYFFTTMAALMLFVKYPERFRQSHKQFIRLIVTTILASVYAFWAIIGVGQDVMFYGVLLLLSSMPVYVGLKWSMRHHFRQIKKI